jgi:hypothetical protein
VRDKRVKERPPTTLSGVPHKLGQTSVPALTAGRADPGDGRAD